MSCNCEICGAPNASRLLDIGFFCSACATKQYKISLLKQMTEHSFNDSELKGAGLAAELAFDAGRYYQFENWSQWERNKFE